MPAGDRERRDLAGRRVVVSAGGTREPIDPVRFISNRSSGKQGHALAEAAADAGRRGGARDHAPPRRSPPASRWCGSRRPRRWKRPCSRSAADADVVVMAAAVADFRPKAPADTKLTKADGVPEIVLEPTPDILAELGRRRRPGQVLVGFAAETHDVGGAGGGQAARPRASTSWWPTTSRPRGWASTTTPTR